MRVRSEWTGNRIISRVPMVRRQAVKRAAYSWFARTQAVVPLDEGTLQRSGKVELDGGSASIVYGTPYGMVQHERLDFHHAPGRTAKYITSVAEPMTLTAIIAGELRRLFH
ncbi:hypothetical protein [Parafrankia sp. EUN1f]|uniref:hypothetical protein n=1 Tax=Parafrankia sp. EUN1f TaxID=102897 RepID=UPI000682B236|nr:hypothetical protein [Parafrankia sp. EUN1f]